MRVAKDSSKSMKVVIAVLSILVLLGFGAAAFFYMNGNSEKNPQTRAVDVKNKVAKLIDVPKDEVPTLGTVSDKEKLKGQPFFKDAQNEDIILIFPQAKKAIIYREKENRLINVGPIAITTEAKDQTKDKTPENQ